MEAGAWEQVVDAAFTHGPALFDSHRTLAVAEWLGRVPRTLKERCAQVALLESAALLFGVGPMGVREKLDEVESVPSISPGERLVADLLRAFLGLAEGSRYDAMTAAERVLAEMNAIDEAALPNLLGLTASRLDVAAAALVAHGVASMYDGKLAVARRDLEAVAEESHGVWRASALGSRALVEAWSGNLTKGEALADRALLLADQLGHDAPSRTTACLALALVARERDELDRAAALLEQIDATGGTRRRPVAVWVATERAHLALARDMPAAGLAALAGSRSSPHPSIPDAVLARRRAVEAHLLITWGDLDGAQGVLDAGLGGETSEVAGARVRLAVERGDVTGARALAEKWPDEPQPQADRERRLWLAVLDHMEGEEAKACSRMAVVVAEADAEGHTGLFDAARKYALGPARALYRAAPTAFLRTLVDRPVTAGRAKPVKGLAEQLTAREYMVLVHLPSRQSNADIAEGLGVSLNTVKTHLKHIYRKLDVVGRSEAVGAAEGLHLL
jgi:LuxR family maltose regulon positive regulatory protein